MRARAIIEIFEVQSDWPIQMGVPQTRTEACLTILAPLLTTEMEMMSTATTSTLNSANNPLRVCIVNIGLFRSGTTTLAEAALSLGLKIYRTFPDLSQEQYRAFLYEPQKLITDWFATEGLNKILRLATEHDLICDGWIALLPFLPTTEIDRLKNEASTYGIHLTFIATTRDADSTVKSELQHWVMYDLEKEAGLDAAERARLDMALLKRALRHKKQLDNLRSMDYVKLLPLQDNIETSWSKTLSCISSLAEKDWRDALQGAGICNANPPLPVEGILLTLRIGSGGESNKSITAVEHLLDQLEQDALCRYLIVLALDSDEYGGDSAEDLMRRLRCRAAQTPQFLLLQVISNLPRSDGEPFAICSVWHYMAAIAWDKGADWVVLLGDDVEMHCVYHYRAIYRAFLDISSRLQVPFGFGSPWINDITFPGFPSFPFVGKAHNEIYGGLIPDHRRANFVNQDLDPYLHRLYSKFHAAPQITEVLLANGTGGNTCPDNKARYEARPAIGWQDFAVSDVDAIRAYLPNETSEALLVDIVVPSYRIRLDYLHSICSLQVPVDMESLFIIIIDNPQLLLERASTIKNQSACELTLKQGEQILEEYLSKGGNRVRVRCNKTNLGASASRNRGLDESAAEFVLNLDDDLVPQPDLLEQYGRTLRTMDDTVAGLVGLVRFPRSPTLPLKHAAVLMSYLTFMFEIATRADALYGTAGPAWGVTANILFRRTKVRFEVAYAKTGGGEDVDFALNVVADHVYHYGGKGRLVAVPQACVVHPFWPGSVWTLMSHFFNWAIGDGGLLQRFPEHRYWSFPNLPEALMFLSPLSIWLGPLNVLSMVPAFLVADFVVDAADRSEYRHRCLLLNDSHGSSQELLNTDRHPLFYASAHVLGNLFVVVLECGRLVGHTRRGQLLRGVCRRFDWHCGRLTKAPSNFRRREMYKFGLFVGIGLVITYFGEGRNPWTSGVATCMNPRWKERIVAWTRGS